MDSRLFSLTSNFAPHTYISESSISDLRGLVSVFEKEYFFGSVKNSFNQAINIIGGKRDSGIYMLSGSDHTTQILWLFKEIDADSPLSGLYHGNFYHQLQLRADGFHTFQPTPNLSLSEQNRISLIDSVESTIREYRKERVSVSGDAKLELRLDN